MPTSGARPGRPVLVAVVLAGLAFVMLQIMVVPLLGRLGSQLGISPGTAGFLLTGQLLAAAVATPLLGRVGDVRGKRLVMLVALGLLVLGCVVAALGTSFAVVLLGRLLQGTGGAVFPLATSLLRDAYPEDEVRGAIATFSVTAGAGGGAGLVLGGVLAATTTGYAAVFWVGAGFAALAFLAVAVLVPESTQRRRSEVDIAGAALLAGWLVCLLLPLSEGNTWGWGSARTLGLLAASVVLVVLWVSVERRVRDPLVDMSVFGERAVLTPPTWRRWAPGSRSTAPSSS